MLSFKIPIQISTELKGEYKTIINLTLRDLNNLIPENKQIIVTDLNINNIFTFNNLTIDEISVLKKNLIKNKNMTDNFRLVKIK